VPRSRRGPAGGQHDTRTVDRLARSRLCPRGGARACRDPLETPNVRRLGRTVTQWRSDDLLVVVGWKYAHLNVRSAGSSSSLDDAEG